MERFLVAFLTLLCAVLLLVACYWDFVAWENFTAACEETGGRPVWDGRQHQCLRRTNQP